MQESPTPSTGHRRPRRAWFAALALALMVSGLSALFLLRSPEASAQALPPTATYTVTCNEDDTITYRTVLTNPNPAGTPVANYYVRLEWSDGRGAVSQLLRAGPGESKEHTLTNAVGVTATWTNTMAVRTQPGTSQAPLVGPIEKTNPCTAPPSSTPPSSSSPSSSPSSSSPSSSPSSSSSSSSPTSSSSPESSTSTTEPTEPSDPSTEPTDPWVNPTTTPVPDDVVNTSGSGGGGLAATGVAVAAILGLGAVLFANGAGLMRLVRRGGSADDE